MQKKRYFVLFLAFILLFFGCADTKPTDTGTPTTIYREDTAETIGGGASELSEMETTEAAPETTAPTASLHSALYIPEYTPQQIMTYFEEVVLNMEYSDGTGDVTRVQKWIEPICYRFYGMPTDMDKAVLEALFAQLNEIPGFPGIYPAADADQENLSISFLEPDVFRDSFSAVVNGENAYGAAQFWYYTASNELHTARIGYRTDLDQSVRNSILIEEIINTLGISDTVLREDSIVYQYSDENTALSDVDWVIMKLLYDPAVQCGMDADSCGALIEKLYY